MHGRVVRAGETATEAGAMHPPGMHSCTWMFSHCNLNCTYTCSHTLVLYRPGPVPGLVHYERATTFSFVLRQ